MCELVESIGSGPDCGGDTAFLGWPRFRLGEGNRRTDAVVILELDFGASILVSRTRFEIGVRVCPCDVMLHRYVER